MVNEASVVADNIATCPACSEGRDLASMTPVALVPATLGQILRQQHPYWDLAGPVCSVCMRQAKAAHLQALLAADNDALPPVVDQVFVSTNANKELDAQLTTAERIAGRVAAAVGTWYFSGAILFLLASWIGLNIWLRPFAPYPVIVLAVISAALGSVAALQGPIILMSQRRLGKQDRVRADNDYRINLKAELEVQYLNEKLDRLYLTWHGANTSHSESEPVQEQSNL